MLFFRGALPRIEDLLTRDIERLDGYPVVLRHVQRERTPATAGLDNLVPVPKLKLPADIVHLGFLRFFEGRRGEGKYAHV